MIVALSFCVSYSVQACITGPEIMPVNPIAENVFGYMGKPFALRYEACGENSMYQVQYAGRYSSSHKFGRAGEPNLPRACRIG